MIVDTALGNLSADVLTGPPDVAVLWHSMFTDSHSWDRVVESLRVYRTLILIDGYGFGSSPGLTHAVHDFVGECAQAAAAVVLEAQRTLSAGTVYWLGSAWGGHVGLHLAATRPELIRSLVTVSSPVHAASPSTRRQVRLLVPVYRAIGMRGPVRSGIVDGMLTDQSQRTDPEAVDTLVAPMSRPDRRTMARIVRSGVLGRTDLSWAVSRITCPTLMIATDDRGEWSPEECAEAVADNARAATITGSRGLPSVERPKELTDLVVDFWRTP